MTLRKWLYLFFTTLLIGGAGAIIAGLLLLLYDQQQLPEMAAYDWWINLRDFFLAGLLFSIVSQAGFFAYMMLNFLVRGAFRRSTWNLLQIVLIGFSIIYLEMVMLSESNSFVHYIVLPVVIFLFSWLVAYFKVKMTNGYALIPTIFFMVVATTLESAPALREHTIEGIVTAILPLLLCNAWQILQLTNLVGNTNSQADNSSSKKK